MNFIVKTVDRFLSIWCLVIMSALTVGVIVSVALRYLFNISFVESEEAITMLFIGTTYFGMALGVRYREHITISYFAEQAPRTVRVLIQVLVMLIIVWVSWTLFRQSLLWIRKVGAVPSPALHIPYVYFYIMVPVSSLIIIFYAFVDILSLFLPIDEPEKGYEADEEIPKMDPIIPTLPPGNEVHP